MGKGPGSTDLGRVGGPGVDPPEKLAAWNDLHSLLGLRHGVHHVTVGFLSAIILKQGTPMWPSEGERLQHHSDQLPSP